MHNPICFEVKGINAKGEVVDSRDYHSPKLHAQSGHWCVVQRMALTISKNRKVKAIKYYMNSIEYRYDAEQCQFIKA